MILSQNTKISMSTLQQKVSEFDLNVNANKKEYAGYTQDGEKTNNRAYYKGNCDHCVFLDTKCQIAKVRIKVSQWLQTSRRRKENFNARFVGYLGLTTPRTIKIKTRIMRRKKNSLEVTLAIGYIIAGGKLLWNLVSKY